MSINWRSKDPDVYRCELSVTVYRPRAIGDIVRAATEADLAKAGYVPVAKLEAAYAMLRANGIATPEIGGNPVGEGR